MISDVSTAHADCSDVSSDKYESSIASHLFEHPDCRAVYSDDCSSIVSRVRSARLLNVLEAVYNFHTKVQLEFNSSDRTAPKKAQTG